MGLASFIALFVDFGIIEERYMDGIINVNKPKGFTSHDVVAKLRGILSTKKIGHTGTLDPDAVGVLPICVGKGTKAVEFLTAAEKQYVAKVKLGAETDTQDASGRIIATSEKIATYEEIAVAVKGFVGEISQIPPMFSAIKQDGKKLYELARKGIEVERKPRWVKISAIEVLEVNLDEQWFLIKVDCSKGTYIRTLCQDIGRKIGSLAYMEELTRTRSGRFLIDSAITLEEIEEMKKKGDLSFLTAVDKMFEEEYDAVYLSERKADMVRNGMKIKTPGLAEGKEYRVYGEDGEFLTISQVVNGQLKILKTFFGGEKE